MTNHTRIPFKVQETGYDRDQVDKYIQKIGDEYQVLKQQYEEVSSRPALQPVQPDVNFEAISKALVDAEVKGIQIVAEAKNEANRIIGNAYVELAQVQQAKERAYLEVTDIVNELKELIVRGRKGIEDAGTNQSGIY